VIASSTDSVPRIRDGLRESLWAFLGARLLLFAISVVGGGALALPPDQPPTDAGFPIPNLLPGWHMLFTATQRQDAAWFLRLATSGYAPGDGSAAFFPLYPLTVRLVAALPAIGPLGAALIVSNAAFLGALIMVHALTRLELGTQAARRTVLFGAFFPTAFFLLAPYTEPLFLLLSIAAFWFRSPQPMDLGDGRRRRCGGDPQHRCAADRRARGRGARPVAERTSVAAAIGRRARVALGPLAYLAYWQVRFGDFWAPLDAQRNWQREATFPLTALWHAVKLTWLYQTWWLIDVIVVGIAIAGILVAAFRVPLTYTVYAGLSVLIPLTFTYEQRTADLDAEVHGGRLPCVVGVRHRRRAPASPRDGLPGRLRGRLLAARLPVHQLAARLLGGGLLVSPETV
jgi:hypothetical protein